MNLYLLFGGLTLASSPQILQAFGLIFSSYGTTVVVMGIMSYVNIYIIKFAVNRHNRFMLVVSFVLDTIIMFVLIQQSSNVSAFTVSDFPLQLRTDCALQIPLIYSREDCMPYYESKRLAGIRLFWASYYSDYQNTASYQALTLIEGDACCGFFAPMNCVPIPLSYPSTFRLDDLSSALSVAEVECGPVEGYYSTKYCPIPYIHNPVTSTVGGCRFDLAVGYCSSNERDIEYQITGCNVAAETAAVALIAPHVFLLVAMTLFNFIPMLWACCMWWKRKESDVFPDLNSKVKDVDYNSVKNQFEVVMMNRGLQRKGYLPYSEEELAQFARLKRNKERDDRKLIGKGLVDESKVDSEGSERDNADDDSAATDFAADKEVA